MIAGIGAGVFSDFRDALQHFDLSVTEVAPNHILTEFYQRIYKEIYLPLCNELAPFNSRIAALRPPQLVIANASGVSSSTGDS